jgi:hypothetical protein
MEFAPDKWAGGVSPHRTVIPGSALRAAAGMTVAVIAHVPLTQVRPQGGSLARRAQIPDLQNP